MDDECLLQALEHIETDASRIQALCRLAVDPADSETDPDIQTVIYIIEEHAERIKTAADNAIKKTYA